MRPSIVGWIGFVGCFLVLISGAAFWLGCKTQDEIKERERKPLNAQAENLDTAIRVIRKDSYPWHNVTFLLARKYEYRMALCDQPEIDISYDDFVSADGEVFDPAQRSPSPLFIFADEGRWPHWASHN